MSQVSVLSPSGRSLQITQYSIECPFCHSNIIPRYLFYDDNKIFASCPNETCHHHFVLTTNNRDQHLVVQDNVVPKNKEFSEIINSISPQFSAIYNQAYYAEQTHLDQICGVGYRKALEFLIKDYLMSKETNDEIKEKIKNKFLNNCIQDDVQNENIKNVAKRAVWLGNDETHYIRKWVDKDVSHLKQLIELTVRWIENEVETERVLKEMSNP
jgi:hypothetical protein